MLGKPIVEERFIYKGYPCVVLFQPLAFRTGYVGLPKTSKYYKENYSCIPISCHGGLTYGRNYLFGQNDEETWWIGFDCAHYGDGYDNKAAKEYYKNDKAAMKQLQKLKDLHDMSNGYWEFRTLDYVKRDCKFIVDQIIELEEGEQQ